MKHAWIAVMLVAVSARADHFDPFASMHGQPPKHERVWGEPVAPDEIVKYAAPALDPAVARRIEAMLDVRGSGGAAVIADRGDRQYFTSPITGTPQVWRQDGAMKLAVQLTGGEDATNVVALSPDEQWLVVSRGGGLYVMDPSGGPLRVVNARAELAYVADDSKALYFGAADGVYRWDLVDGKTTRVFDTPGAWQVLDHRGDRWLMRKELGSAHDEIWEYDLATKALVPVIGQHEAAAYGAAYGAKQILLHTKHGLYALEAGTLTPIVPQMTSFAIDHARARIYYTMEHRLYVLDARTLRRIELPALPESDDQAVAGLSRNGRFAQIEIDGARLPPTTLTLDWTAKKLTEWRVPAVPEIDVKAFAPVAVEKNLLVRRPASCEEPCPVVVLVGEHAMFSPYAQLLVEAGVVVVEPEGGDVEEVVAYVRSAWRAPKVGVVGGYDAVRAMAYADAGVAVDPILDPAELAQVSQVPVKAPLLVIAGADHASAALMLHDETGELILFPDARNRATIALQIGHSIAFLQKHLEAR